MVLLLRSQSVKALKANGDQVIATVMACEKRPLWLPQVCTKDQPVLSQALSSELVKSNLEVSSEGSSTLDSNSLKLYRYSKNEFMFYFPA